LVILLALSFGAQAQSVAIDADPFDAAGSLLHTSGTVQGEGARLTGEGLAGGLFAHLAEDPVVIRYQSGAVQPVLHQILGTTLYADYTYRDLLRVDVVLPFYAYADAPLAPYQAAAFGDLALRGLVPVYERGDTLHLAFAPTIELPTGTKRALLHRGFNVRLKGVVSGEYKGFGYLGNLGVTVSPADSIGSVRMGSTLDAVAGGWYRLGEHFRAGGDVAVRIGLPGGTAAESRNHSGDTTLFAQTIAKEGLTATVGVGGGLLGGVGAPEYRAFFSFGYAPLVSDKDRDGFPDPDDLCPLEPEDFDAFEDEDGCPEADNDGDGLVDTVDQCPMDPEDPDEFEDEDGCPDLDNDQDDIADVDDACPLEPGVPELQGCPKPPDTDEDGLLDDVDECPEEAGPEATQGCPDREGDLVPDFRDRCPDDPRPADEDPSVSDGCPKRVFYSGKAITITDTVQFDTGRSTIKSASFELLDEVAAVFTANPWIQKVEVGGHTDSDGSEAANSRLSQARATAVMDYLVKKGVSPERLTAMGYGEAKPIAPNRTPVGKAKNRRVEFQILEQHPPVRERAFDPRKDAKVVNETVEVPTDVAPEQPAPPVEPPAAPEGVDEAAPSMAPEVLEPVEPVAGEGTELPEVAPEPEPEPEVAPVQPAPPKEKRSSRKRRKSKGEPTALPDDGLPLALDPMRLLEEEGTPPAEPTEPTEPTTPEGDAVPAEDAPWDAPEAPRTGSQE